MEETASGAVHLHIKPSAGNRPSTVREGSIVVLTLTRPPPRGALEWAQGDQGKGRHGGKGSPGPAAKKPRCVLFLSLSLFLFMFIFIFMFPFLFLFLFLLPLLLHA